ncbi:MAG: hypothetical protein IJS51_11275 [Treponema sp.]|nr:hypothetical protein [Treponema sp.]
MKLKSAIFAEGNDAGDAIAPEAAATAKNSRQKRLSFAKKVFAFKILHAY